MFVELLFLKASQKDLFRTISLVHHYDTVTEFSEISSIGTLLMRKNRVQLIGTELWRNSMEEVLDA